MRDDPRVEVVARLPAPDDYVALCAAVGWTPSDASDRALEGSLAAVCAFDEGKLVGMGRLVGDGAMYCFAVDVVVAPTHQRRGVGRAVMQQLETLVVERSLAARLDLVAADDVRAFYERLGYEPLRSDLMRKSL
jgi:ribosomal protein S18 acetylase RimI-like enzyme